MERPLRGRRAERHVSAKARQASRRCRQVRVVKRKPFQGKRALRQANRWNRQAVAHRAFPNLSCRVFAACLPIPLARLPQAYLPAKLVRFGVLAMRLCSKPRTAYCAFPGLHAAFVRGECRS
jgi:hypothetical protein